MEEPDSFGFAKARNLEKMNKAGYGDRDPVQQGMSKMMCDLYCTEQAVKEGDATILTNIQTSHRVMMTNVERLLDYHTQTVMWGMGVLRDQLTDAHASHHSCGGLRVAQAGCNRSRLHW